MKFGTKLFGLEIYRRGTVVGFSFWYPVRLDSLSDRDRQRSELTGTAHDTVRRGNLSRTRSIFRKPPEW